MAFDARQAEQQMTCARQEEMGLMAGQKRDEAKVETVESKWRGSAGRGTEAIGRLEAGEQATETEQVAAEPYTACLSVA